ncbi:FtsQ-type POTRA domain-containing protein [bacterium]|nr:FtsQ-type POTRA domain-containing protein [bacterium]
MASGSAPWRRRRAMATRRRGPWWKLLLALIVFAVALAGFGSWQGLRALLGSDWLRLREVRVEGCRVLPAARVQERLAPLLGRPLYGRGAVDLDSLALALTDLPRLKGVTLKRRPPATLECRVEEAVGVALWLEGDFVEIDAGGLPLERFGDPAPDLPIIRPAQNLGADSLRRLALAALGGLRGADFDLAREVSEMTADSTGIVYYRGDSPTRVRMGWEDFGARARCYRELFAEIAADTFPGELDLRYRDQVVARKSTARAKPQEKP